MTELSEQSAVTDQSVGELAAELSAGWVGVTQEGEGFGPITITPNDVRYRDVALRGYNRRVEAAPDVVRLVGSMAQIVQAVDEAVRQGKRVGVRSGGHCLEPLVDDPDIGFIVDLSEMREVRYDPTMGAFSVEAGATLGQIFRSLYYGWGVTIPGGACPTVGAGGHITGGGYGPLSRQHGVVADHLYAVEVVTVGPNGARAIVATREPHDPLRDLWWAHTGGGGGSFGIVTRFWLRSPKAVPGDPTLLLPRAPGAMTRVSLSWKWADLIENKAEFVRIARNFGTWLEQNSAPGQPANRLNVGFFAPRANPAATSPAPLDVTVVGQVDPTVNGNEQLLAGFLAAVQADVCVAPVVRGADQVLPWLNTTLTFVDSGIALGVQGPLRNKTKGAYLRTRYTDAQIETVFDYLTDPDYAHPAGVFAVAAYGGQINAVPEAETATSHRNAVMLSSVYNYWDNPAEDAKHLAWVRGFYRDLHQDTGGVPVPGDRYDGCYVNWPDVDLKDPTLNTSTASWADLVYKDNYPRLQRIKQQWDSDDVFRHDVSVELPE